MVLTDIIDPPTFCSVEKCWEIFSVYFRACLPDGWQPYSAFPIVKYTQIIPAHQLLQAVCEGGMNFRCTSAPRKKEPEK
jgi:hypothetical protein